MIHRIQSRFKFQTLYVGAFVTEILYYLENHVRYARLDPQWYRYPLNNDVIFGVFQFFLSPQSPLVGNHNKMRVTSGI
jgi:hypothetical protein